MNILIVKTTSLGDIIQSLPVLALLKEKFPNAKIDWVVENSFAELLSAHPGIHRVIPVEVRKWKKNLITHRTSICSAIKTLRQTSYDLLIDLQGNVKSAIITWAAKAKEKIGFNLPTAPEWPAALPLTHRYAITKTAPIALQYLSIVEKHFSLEPKLPSTELKLRLTEQDEEWLSSVLVSERPRYMICTGSQWENKKLSLPTWIELLKQVSSEKKAHYYLVWGSEKERQEASALHAQFPRSSTLLPRLSIPLWQRLMSHMDAIFSVDSSALHLAATTSVPTYSFFGPSNASIYKPPGSNHHALQGPCPYGKTFPKRCSLLRSCKTGACLKALTPEQLSKSVLQNLANK